jgi:hypothetical protein
MVVESSPSRLKYAPAVVVAEAHFVIVHGSVFGEWDCLKPQRPSHNPHDVVGRERSPASNEIGMSLESTP